MSTLPDSTTPTLAVRLPDGPVRAVALVLHGGRSLSTAPTRPWQLAVIRMLPFVRSLRRAGSAQGLAVARLRFRVRGWNDADRSPVPDAQWALDQLAERFPGVPIALVGHSMGGRTALYAAAHESVRVVVGLAPWVEPGDDAWTIPGLAGRRLLVLHGALDRMTDPSASAAYVRAAAPIAASAGYVSVSGDKHAMLGRAALWHELATGFVIGALCGELCGESPVGTSQSSSTNGVQEALAGALAGAPSLVV